MKGLDKTDFLILIITAMAMITIVTAAIIIKLNTPQESSILTTDSEYQKISQQITEMQNKLDNMQRTIDDNDKKITLYGDTIRELQRESDTLYFNAITDRQNIDILYNKLKLTSSIILMTRTNENGSINYNSNPTENYFDMRNYYDNQKILGAQDDR
jgi:Cu/Ag efflux protein CusF